MFERQLNRQKVVVVVDRKQLISSQLQLNQVESHAVRIFYGQ